MISFKTFGKIRYCRITKDPCGVCKGTAFVCFWKREDAQACLKAATAAAASNHLARREENSVLIPEVPSSSTDIFELRGRFLHVLEAKSREEASRLEQQNQKYVKNPENKRNLYLLKEGVIPDTPEFRQIFTSEEIIRRNGSFRSRKKLLGRKSDLYISKTRVTIRFLPNNITLPELRKTALAAITKFKEEVKAGKRLHLTERERTEGWDKMPKIRRIKVLKSDGQGNNNYGYVEFNEHAHALAMLRYINANPNVFPNSKPPLAEFAFETLAMKELRNKDNVKGSAVLAF